MPCWSAACALDATWSLPADAILETALGSDSSPSDFGNVSIPMPAGKSLGFRPDDYYDGQDGSQERYAGAGRSSNGKVKRPPACGPQPVSLGCVFTRCWMVLCFRCPSGLSSRNRTAPVSSSASAGPGSGTQLSTPPRHHRVLRSGRRRRWRARASSCCRRCEAIGTTREPG